LQPKVAIVILNYNSYKLTINLLEELKSIEYENISVIVVDNNSPNESYTYLKKYISGNNCNYETKLIKSEKNGGYSSGNNLGIKKAEKLNSKYVLIMNNDIHFKDYKVINNLVKKMENDDEIAASGPQILTENGDIQLPLYEKEKFLNVFFKKLFNPLHLFMSRFQKDLVDKERYVYTLCGCFVMMRLKDIKKINFFDENIFFYGEEIIWGEKFEKINKKVLYVPGTIVYHEIGSTIQKFYDSSQIHEMVDKNMLYYYKKYREDIGIVKYSLLKFAFFIKRKVYHSVYTGIKNIENFKKKRRKAEFCRKK